MSCPGGTLQSSMLLLVETPNQGLAHPCHADHSVAIFLQLVQHDTGCIIHVVLPAAAKKQDGKVTMDGRGTASLAKETLCLQQNQVNPMQDTAVATLG